jgi:uncharacterized membrane-anchored protein
MNKIKLLSFVNLLLLAIFFMYSVYGKEKTISEGKLIYFRLAPVDPRSLMQGDYMQLRYAVTRNIYTDNLPSRGKLYVTINDSSIAVVADVHSVESKGKVYPINYFSSKWVVSIGAESYFFQEGNADHYSKALYGGLRVNESGESVLVGLYDTDLKRL